MPVRILLLLLVPLVIGLPSGYEYNEWDDLEQSHSPGYEDLQEILTSSDATPDHDITQPTTHLQSNVRGDARLMDESKIPRTHIKGDEYDYDIQAMILSLIHQHHIARNAVYKYVNQGMKNHSIFDLEDFKKECIERWLRNKATWGKGSASRSGRDKGPTKIAEAVESGIAVLPIEGEVGSEEEDEPAVEGKVVYKRRSDQGGCWRYTREGLILMEELKSYGMARDTARRYMDKGIKNGEIDHIEKFKEDCKRKYQEKGIMLGRYGTAARSSDN